MFDAVSRETIQIPSVEKGLNLDVWFYKPQGSGPYPVVIAGHGMTAIKEAGLSAFGEAWASSAGFASLILDYRFFGDSDGEPRNFLSLKKQLEDYKSVIKWARERPETFRNDKIVVMGSALSGITVANLLLQDPGLAAGMAHCPLLDGYSTLLALPFNVRLGFWAIVDYVRGKLGLSPVFIPAVGEPDTFAVLNTPSAKPGFEGMLAQGNKRISDTLNIVPARIIIEFMGARLGRNLKDAHSKYLIVLAQEDDIFPNRIAREVAAAAPEKVILVEAPGGHFEIMEGGKGFEININAQISFLRELL
ncbi:alpha/beta-hydrolase [Gymnopus androsaceus JB14]|uniref:Alpha/beta-hydrolase n=1 Tax=Gymnopus androsaceus JB14 TaxID=1447944 RepID=A0A6A4GYN3_9AGAR|nr:alpha/beta-hydrolase [Gymnopus androsaceus JB14]